MTYSEKMKLTFQAIIRLYMFCYSFVCNSSYNGLECKMGCLQSKPEPERIDVDLPKVYSWDKRTKLPETKDKFYVRDKSGLQNSVHRTYVNLTFTL